jgi:hypothetical protein
VIWKEAVMASAVVAVFDEYDEAQSTVNELISAGFESTEVKMDEAELFGDDEFKAYDEAVRHGRHVVTAYASTDERSDLASEVMSHHNPVGLDESSSGVRVFYDMYEVPVEEDQPQRTRSASDTEG